MPPRPPTRPRLTGVSPFPASAVAPQWHPGHPIPPRQGVQGGAVHGAAARGQRSGAFSPTGRPVAPPELEMAANIKNKPLNMAEGKGTGVGDRRVRHGQGQHHLLGPGAG